MKLVSCCSLTRSSPINSTCESDSRCTKYVMEDSELQINIDGKTRTAIEVAVSSSSPPSSDVFDGAVEEILELMYNSSFMKFQSSAQAQELLEKMG